MEVEIQISFIVVSQCAGDEENNLDFTEKNENNEFILRNIRNNSALPTEVSCPQIGLSGILAKVRF